MNEDHAMPNLEHLDVTHDDDAQTFSLSVAGQLAHLDYHRRPGLLSLDHTYVPPPIEGQGVAAKLTQFALDYARRQNLRVVPNCSYVAAFIAKHDEYQDLVAQTPR
jgi:uncharacterized protein